MPAHLQRSRTPRQPQFPVPPEVIGYLTHGGDSPLGKGGRAQMYENPAIQDATGYGGGGAGNVNAAFNVLYDDGTAGTGGIIIVHEYK